MMKQDRRIGRVVLVRTYKALVELDTETASYVKLSHQGLYPIAAVNSYVVLPIGSERIIGIVTGLDMAEEPEVKYQSRQMLVLPHSRKTIWISLIGTIVQGTGSNREFQYGIRRYPELDNPVWFAVESDLDVIFYSSSQNSKKRDRMISIGKSPLFRNYEIRLDMDAFFGKHAAVLGNTGSGKSCTVAAIIKAVLGAPSNPRMPHAHFIIFDTNSEYEAAFTKWNGPEREGVPSEILYQRLVVSNDGDTPTGFWVPHWFMNGMDYAAFFRPGEGAQGPLLYAALSAARAEHQRKAFESNVLRVIETHIDRITSILDENGPAAAFGRKNFHDEVSGVTKLLEVKTSKFKGLGLEQSLSKYKDAFTFLSRLVAPPESRDAGRVDASASSSCREQIDCVRVLLRGDREAVGRERGAPVGIDTPKYFSFDEFVLRVIGEELEREAHSNPNLRNWVGTLLLRLEQARQDPRYAFLFKPARFDFALASFLRLIFGVDPARNFSAGDGNPPWAEVYGKQHDVPVKQHNVTILDFSHLASDVLENITALIGRLILEFMQRCPERGKYPVVLILEEAHHYIPAEPVNERQQRARAIFERIAKEGRKYGLSLVVASQRPSELSRTVMSQCNSFIVHRIQNPDDQKYFKSVVSNINSDLLDQLPILPQQHALVLGDCVALPFQVRINDVDPKPDSRDPEFFSIWSDPKTQPPDFEAICQKWEGLDGNMTRKEPEQSTSYEATVGSSADACEVAAEDDLPF